MTTSIAAPLLCGGAGVMTDRWDAREAVSLLARTGVTVLTGAPVFVSSIAAIGVRLPALRRIRCGATAVPPELVGQVSAALGVPPQAAWGMSEVLLGTLADPRDPADWAAHATADRSPASRSTCAPTVP